MVIEWQSVLYPQENRYYSGGAPLFYGQSVVEGVSALILTALKSLVIDIGDMGMTLMPQGNTLPISIVTQTPTATPAGNKGVCFKISGGVLTIYGWDTAAQLWRANN